MGAVEHLKTLCCLGLPRESALIAVTPLLHEIIPHGATRFALLEPDATIGCGYNENPDASVLLRERLWALMQDPSGPGPLWLPGFIAAGIGWTLPMQTWRWLDSRWVSEIERPLDSCWILDAMVVDGGQSIAFLETVSGLGSRMRFGDSPARWRRITILPGQPSLRCSEVR